MDGEHTSNAELEDDCFEKTEGKTPETTLPVVKIREITISNHEKTFWEQLIARYLHPITLNNTGKAVIAAQLDSFRNQWIRVFLLFHLIMIILFLFLSNMEVRMSFTGTSEEDAEDDPSTMDPFTILLVSVSTMAFLVQFGAMISHRLMTLSDMLVSDEGDSMTKGSSGESLQSCSNGKRSRSKSEAEVINQIMLRENLRRSSIDDASFEAPMSISLGRHGLRYYRLSSWVDHTGDQGKEDRHKLPI